MTTRIQAALAARTDLVNDLNALNDALEVRSATPAEDRQRNVLEVQIAGATDALQAAVNADAAEKRYDTAFGASGYKPGNVETRNRTAEIDAEADTFFREAKRDDVLEVRSFGDTIETRAALFTTGLTARGADTVPTSIGQVVESRINVAGLVERGLTILPTISGEDLHVPRRAGLSQFSRKAEGATIDQSDPTLAGVDLKAYKAAAIAKASNEFLADSRLNVVQFVGKQFGDSADLYIEEALMTGAQNGDAFTGGIASGTVGTTLASASAITADELLDLAHSIGQRYRRNAVMLLAPSVVTMARKLKSASGEYIWRDLVDGTGTIAGIEVIESPFTAELDGTASAIVGAVLDPSAMAVRLAGGLRIDRSDEIRLRHRCGRMARRIPHGLRHHRPGRRSHPGRRRLSTRPSVGRYFN